MVVILLFIGVAVQPAVAIYNPLSQYGNNNDINSIDFTKDEIDLSPIWTELEFNEETKEYAIQTSIWNHGDKWAEGDITIRIVIYRFSFGKFIEVTNYTINRYIDIPPKTMQTDMKIIFCKDFQFGFYFAYFFINEEGLNESHKSDNDDWILFIKLINVNVPYGIMTIMLLLGGFFPRVYSLIFPTLSKFIH
jgi:hypothetical protein